MDTGALSPAAVCEACAHTDYEVLLGGDSYAVRSATMIGGTGGAWPVMEAVMGDDSILPLLTGTMLGPNREYAEIRVRGSGQSAHTLYANLTSYAHVSSRLTLKLSVLRASRGT